MSVTFEFTPEGECIRHKPRRHYRGAIATRFLSVGDGAMNDVVMRHVVYQDLARGQAGGRVAPPAPPLSAGSAKQL